MSFVRCPKCSKRLGSPALCSSCIINRGTIEQLRVEAIHWKDKYKQAEGMLDILWNILNIKKNENI